MNWKFLLFRQCEPGVCALLLFLLFVSFTVERKLTTGSFENTATHKNKSSTALNSLSHPNNIINAVSSCQGNFVYRFISRNWEMGLIRKYRVERINEHCLRFSVNTIFPKKKKFIFTRWNTKQNPMASRLSQQIFSVWINFYRWQKQWIARIHFSDSNFCIFVIRML